MKNFMVEIPFCGKLTVNIEAENEKEAIKLAFENTDFSLKLINQNEKYDYEIEEWGTFEKIIEGNVSHAILNEVECYEN